MIIKTIRVDNRFYQRKNQNQTNKKPKQAKSNQGKKRHKPYYNNRAPKLIDINKVQKKGNKQKQSPKKEKWFKKGVYLGYGK